MRGIDATIQARVGSSRLPGKVLKTILGKPMLELQIERIRQSRLIDRVIIATTLNPEDDPIEQLALRLECQSFRGSENDVLGRVVGALVAYDVDLHVEFQGDNPMPDALLLDATIGYFLKHATEYDYVTNALTTTYPPGSEVAVYPAAVLIDANSRTGQTPLREHVGLHIYQHPDRYRIANLEAPTWFCRPELHLEVDTVEDLDLVSAIFEHFYPNNPAFSLAQIIEFTDRRRDLTDKNRGLARRWEQFRQRSPRQP